MQQLEEALKDVEGRQQPGVDAGASLGQCLSEITRCHLVLISVAGEYAAELAYQALDRNLNAALFPITSRWTKSRKTRAREKGLLVMGPDCGTSMIAGMPLAFANVMPEGNIGVIGASGTRIQELCSQIALAGEGFYSRDPPWRPRPQP